MPKQLVRDEEVRKEVTSGNVFILDGVILR